METLAIAIIAVLGPVLLAWLQGRQNAKKEEAANIRADLLAERLDAAAKLVRDRELDVAAQAKEAAALLAADQAKVAEATRTASEKLDAIVSTTAVIHTLVNSSLTAAIERQSYLANRLIGGEPLTSEEIAHLKAEIIELGLVLKDRRKQAIEAQKIIEDAPAGVLTVPQPVKVIGDVTIAPAKSPPASEPKAPE